MSQPLVNHFCLKWEKEGLVWCESELKTIIAHLCTLIIMRHISITCLQCVSKYYVSVLSPSHWISCCFLDTEKCHLKVTPFQGRIDSNNGSYSGCFLTKLWAVADVLDKTIIIITYSFTLASVFVRRTKFGENKNIYFAGIAWKNNHSIPWYFKKTNNGDI